MEHSLLLLLVHLFPHSIYVDPVVPTPMLGRDHIKLDRGWSEQCDLAHKVLSELLVVQECVWVTILVIESLLEGPDGCGNDIQLPLSTKNNDDSVFLGKESSTISLPRMFRVTWTSCAKVLDLAHVAFLSGRGSQPLDDNGCC